MFPLKKWNICEVEHLPAEESYIFSEVGAKQIQNRMNIRIIFNQVTINMTPIKC